MNLKAKHENTTSELKAAHGNCFKSEFREFKKGGFIFHFQFTKPATKSSIAAIRKRLDSFLQTVKSHQNNLEKTL